MAERTQGQPKLTLNEILPSDSIGSLIDSAPDGFVIANSRGRIVFVNTPGEKLFGYPEDELLGQPVEILLPEVFRHEHVRYREEFMSAPRTRPMGLGLDLYGRRKDESEFPVEISLSPVQTDHELMVMAIIRDVTEYKRERQISQTLQNALLSPLPEGIAGLKMASVYRSAYAGALVGGDLFDVFELQPGLVAISIGDVSGKGVNAAVHTALAKYSFRAYAYVDPDPAYVMERLNRAVYRESAIDSFITFFYGLLDVEKGTICCANAGHMPPLHLVCPNEEITEVVISGMPLGVCEDASYEQHAVSFRSGDRMLFYSDGVTDAKGENGLYGMTNLIEFFRRGGCDPPADFISGLARTLENWSGGHLQDDVTSLLVSID